MIGTHAKRYATAESRWVGVGTYYAMFPARFADRVIEKYTQRGDTVIDPFAGRGTALFSAAVKGRHGLGD
jgi:DNA modification methylase